MFVLESGKQELINSPNYKIGEQRFLLPLKPLVDDNAPIFVLDYIGVPPKF